MDPLSVAVGVGAGFVGSKVLGGKKKASRKKSTGKTRKSTTTRRKTTSAGSAGINKRTGRLKKGFKYQGGKVVKAKG